MQHPAVSTDRAPPAWALLVAVVDYLRLIEGVARDGVAMHLAADASERERALDAHQAVACAAGGAANDIYALAVRVALDGDPDCSFTAPRNEKAQMFAALDLDGTADKLYRNAADIARAAPYRAAPGTDEAAA
jgi:hypothetical protein